MNAPRRRSATLIAAALVIAGLGASPATAQPTLWTARYTSPDGDRFDEARASAVSPDGTRVFVTGSSYDDSSGGYESCTIAYSAWTGTTLWTTCYDGLGASEQNSFAMAVSPDGARVFVTGTVAAPGGSRWGTVAYDAFDGDVLWGSGFGGGKNDAPASIAVSPDGSNVFVTGTSFGANTGYDLVTLAYDAATGNENWHRRYTGPGRAADAGNSLAVSPDGSAVFVAGSTQRAGTGNDYVTLAYDAVTGSFRWVTRYDGPGDAADAASELAVNPSGTEVFVTGRSYGTAFTLDIATIAYDAGTGARLWLQRYNGPGHGLDEGDGVAVDPDGAAVYVTGDSTGKSSSRDFATIAYAASTGAKLWAERYNGSGNGFDQPRAIGVDPDGSKVFVSGVSFSAAGSSDFATVAYDAASGARIWVRRYNGPGDGLDEAWSQSLSPDGSRVFVIGASLGATSGVDYATLAYAA